MTDGARDPGLQPERTRLAWRRTTLSCTVAAVLAAKASLQGPGGHGGPGGRVLPVLVCALCLMVWLGFLTVAHRRIRHLSGSAAPPLMTPLLAVGAVCCTVALAVCAVAVVV